MCVFGREQGLISSHTGLGHGLGWDEQGLILIVLTPAKATEWSDVVGAEMVGGH